MPYEWLPPDEPDGGACRRLHLWPYRSLPRRGFVLFIGLTAGLVALPLLFVLGSPVLWGLLPFVVLAVAGVWWGLQRSYSDGEIIEDLTLSADSIALVRHGPRGRRQEWRANPYWVRVTVRQTGGPAPNYLTLSGAGREVELGAFLTGEERLRLADELRAALRGEMPAPNA
jgi:uncharacterized membrane protein